jgi:hypothetical protein
LLKTSAPFKRFFQKRQIAFYDELAGTDLPNLADKEPENFVAAVKEVARWIVDGARGRRPVSWQDRRHFSRTLIFEVSPQTRNEKTYWDLKTKREAELFPVDDLESWIRQYEIADEEDQSQWINLTIEDDWTDVDIENFLLDTKIGWDYGDLVELGASDEMLSELSDAIEKFEEAKEAAEYEMDNENYYNEDNDEYYDQDGEWYDIDQEVDPAPNWSEFFEGTWKQHCQIQ